MWTSVINRSFRDLSSWNLELLEKIAPQKFVDFGDYDGLDIHIRTKIFRNTLYKVYNDACHIKSKTVPESKET